MAIAGLQGVWVGYAATLYKQTEDSAIIGVNRFITVVAQVASIANAIYIRLLSKFQLIILETPSFT